MATCISCGKQVGWMDVVKGQCRDCWEKAPLRTPEDVQTAKAALTEQASAKSAAAQAVLLTTETILPEGIATRLGVVTGTCIYGQHLGRDIMTAWRDMTGGRAAAAEKVFADAREAALMDLRRQAHDLGADAVIALSLTHQELAGGGKSMVMVTATGTAVKLSQKT